MHSPRMHTARLEAGRMHIEPVRTHKQAMMPATRMDHRNIPCCKLCQTRKKVANGTNEHADCSALKEIRRCHRYEREMSGVIMKLKKNLEFCRSLSNQTDRDRSFGC